jgi:hypothetical protein
MENEKLLGVWKLVSYEIRLADGIVVRPMGRGVRGILMYDSSGHMAFQVIDADRPLFASDDWLRGTPEEIRSAFEGCIAYFGTFKVNEAKGTVVHHVEGSSFPNWCGTDREQFFELSGNRLTLMTPPMTLSGEQAVGYLTWERAQPAAD